MFSYRAIYIYFNLIMDSNLTQEEKVRNLFKAFNDFVITEATDKTKKIRERVDKIKERNSVLFNEYRSLFENPNDSENFPFLDILNSLHNDITRGYHDFMTMLFRKFQNREAKGTEVHVALSERLELLWYLQYDNIFKLISSSHSNDKFEDLIQIKYILTDEKYQWMPFLYEDFLPKLKEQFPNLVIEIDRFDKSDLEKSIYEIMMEIDKENNYAKTKSYLNVENFLEKIKTSALNQARWEFYEDPIYSKAKGLVDTNGTVPEEIKIDIENLQQIGFERGLDFEKTDYVYQTVPLIISEFKTYEKLNQQDLELLMKRVKSEVLEKSTLSNEEKLSILLDLIKLFEKSDIHLIKTETIKTLNILGEVLASKHTLTRSELRLIFEKRLDEAQVNLGSVLIAGFTDIFNPQAFACVVGIANHLDLFDKTYSQYLQNFL